MSDVAMKGQLDLTAIRASLLRTPEAIHLIAATLSGEVLNFREAPNTWNIFEVLCHLAEAEISDWIPRVLVTLSGSAERRLPPFDREAGFARYRGWTGAAIAAEFQRLRGESVEKLDSFHITAENLDRTGIHPEFGPVPLRQLLATWVTHDYAHLAQVSRLLVRYHGQFVGPWRAYFSLLREPAKTVSG